MGRFSRHWSRAFWVLLALGLGGTPALALETEKSAANVQCPTLSATPERAAAFEARALLELTLRGAEGQLTVVCPEQSLELRWAPRGGPNQTAWVDPEPLDTLIDRMIAALEPLTRTVHVPKPKPKPAKRHRVARKRPTPEKRWALSLGGIGEAWGGLDQLSLGVSLGGAAKVDDVRLSLVGMAQQQVSNDSLGLELVAYRARAMVDYGLLPGDFGLDVGLGATLGAFIAKAPEGIEPRSQHSWAMAVGWRMRGSYRVDSVLLLLGPEANVNLARPVLFVGNQEAGPLTPLTWGLTAEMQGWL